MPPWGRTLRVARGKGARSRRSRGLGARPPPAPSLSVSRAPWAGCGSRCGAWLTLSVFLRATVDPTLRRLCAPLSGAILQGRPQGGFWRYAPGLATRGCGLLAAGLATRCGCSREAALQGPRVGRRGAVAPGRQPYKGRGMATRCGCSGEAALQGPRVWRRGAAAPGKQPYKGRGFGDAVRLLQGSSPTMLGRDVVGLCV